MLNETIISNIIPGGVNSSTQVGGVLITSNLTAGVGLTGPAGANGVGVPNGGTANQVLSKIDSTNGNTQWSTPTTGSVTSASVVTANGISGTVANPTTTPAITLFLNAITPTSVAASGSVTGSNLSGTNTGNETNASIKTALGITTLSGSNTGDQTNVSGTAGTITGVITESQVTNLTTDLAAKQAAISLTTVGTSGAASLIGATLNIPNYASGGGGITKGFAIAMALALG